MNTPIENVCADVVRAASLALKSHGIDRPAVVINFAWTDDGQELAVGTAIPRRHRRMLADSLTQSAEEARS